MSKLRDKLKDKYVKQIRLWDWGKIRYATTKNIGMMDEVVIGAAYLGTYEKLLPKSTSANRDRVRAWAYSHALQAVAGEHDLVLSIGEADRTDIHALQYLGSREGDVFYENEGFWYRGMRITNTEAGLKNWVTKNNKHIDNVWSVSADGDISYYINDMDEYLP